MTSERAYDINSLLLDHSFWRMGLCEKPASLSSLSLDEMVEATRIVQADNHSNTGRFTVVCDDRLIAALYTVYHYPASNPECIEEVCAAVDGRLLVVVDQRCVRPETEEQAA